MAVVRRQVELLKKNKQQEGKDAGQLLKPAGLCASQSRRSLCKKRPGHKPLSI